MPGEVEEFDEEADRKDKDWTPPEDGWDSEDSDDESLSDGEVDKLKKDNKKPVADQRSASE